MYTGVVFDFDGVLYDSEKHWEYIENSYLSERIPTWNPNNHKHLIGRSLHESYIYLRSKGLQLSEEQYTSEYQVLADKLYAQLAKPLPGLKQLLRALQHHGAKIAIASSSKHTWINASLQNNALPVDFQTIISAEDDDIANGKPAPDVYLKAAECLNEQPARLIAIEDSRNGALSATTAGLYCLGLRNGFNDHQDLSMAHEVIEGYSTESIARILELLA